MSARPFLNSPSWMVIFPSPCCATARESGSAGIAGIASKAARGLVHPPRSRRRRVGGQRGCRLEARARLVPLARLVRVECAEVAERRGVCRVEPAREAVETFGLAVARWRL